VTTRLEPFSASGLSGRPYAGRLVVRGVWVVLCIGAAAVDLRYGTKAIAGTFVVTAIALLLRARAFGVLLGLAVVGALDGYPGVDVNPAGKAIGHVQDVFALAILLGSFYVVASGRVAPRTSLQRSLYVACSVLALWWTITWARTVIFGVVPASLAARFARDFLYFALTLPLLCDVLVTYPRLRRQLYWTLGVFGAIFATAALVRAQTSANLNFIVHSHFQSTFQGSTRVYSSMTMLVRAAFALSLGTLVLGPTARARRWAIVPTALFGAEIAAQLTRAAYFGAVVGFLVAAVIWWFRRGSMRTIARKQLIVVPVLLAVLVAATAAVSAGERNMISKVATRAATGFSDANSSSGTVASRTQTGHEMLRILGGDWPIGLGFQHPSAHPYPTLPQNSIRNGDQGVLNVVMLMGVVGAALLYLPVLLVLLALVRRRPELATADDEWVRLGATIWIVAVIASSITLGELFSFGGLELSALVLALAVSALAPRYAGTAAAAT